jgi:hypothetical protein
VGAHLARVSRSRREENSHGQKRKKVVSHIGRDTKAGFVSADIEAPDVPDYVLVELRYESPVAYTRSKFAAPAAAAGQAETLNNVLAKYDIATMRSHFGLPSESIKARVEVAATLPPEPEPKKFAKKGMDTDFIRAVSFRSCRSGAVTRRRSPGN